MIRKIRFPGFKDKALTFSYDDGVKQDIRFMELLKKYGMKGTFNLGYKMSGATKNHLLREEYVDVYANSGMEVAIHGCRHLSLSKVSVEDTLSEVLDDRKGLEGTFNRVINGMAYAFGTYNQDTLKVLETCGIKYARTTKSTYGFDFPENWLEWHPTIRHADPKLMDVAKNFLEGTDNYWRQDLKVFYLWGHTYEFDNDNNWNVIEDFCSLMGNRDDIWYATNKEIYEYVEASKRLEFSSDMNYVFNPSSVPIYMECWSKKVVVQPNSVTCVKDE